MFAELVLGIATEMAKSKGGGLGLQVWCERMESRSKPSWLCGPVCSGSQVPQSEPGGSGCLWFPVGVWSVVPPQGLGVSSAETGLSSRKAVGMNMRLLADGVKF